MKETFYRFDFPLKICLLADIHNRPFDEISRSLERQQPDMIAVAGDFLYTYAPTDDIPVMLRTQYSLSFLADCAKHAPTFVSLGNHEWMLSDKDKQIITDTGVNLLDNTWTEFNGVFIGALTSSGVSAYAQFRKGKDRVYPKWQHFNSPQRNEPVIGWLDEFEKQRGKKLLLCHHPEYRDKYLKDRSIDLILSGHAHGGQIRLLGRGLYAPGQGVFPRYTSGIHANMIISRGLSNTAGFIPRLFNPREIVYIAAK